jgi:hypothetical protein
MPRTVIPIQQLPRNGAGIATLTWTAWDGTNTMYFDNDGKTLLLFQNRSNGGTKVATVKSVADPTYGRTGDLAVVCPVAGGAPLQDGNSIHGPFPPESWCQPSGSSVNVDGAVQADFYVAAVRLP